MPKSQVTRSSIRFARTSFNHYCTSWNFMQKYLPNWYSAPTFGAQFLCLGNVLHLLFARPYACVKPYRSAIPHLLTYEKESVMSTPSLRETSLNVLSGSTLITKPITWLQRLSQSSDLTKRDQILICITAQALERCLQTPWLGSKCDHFSLRFLPISKGSEPVRDFPQQLRVEKN